MAKKADKSRRADALVEDKSIGGILRKRRQLIEEGRLEEAAQLMSRRNNQSTDSNNR